MDPGTTGGNGPDLGGNGQGESGQGGYEQSSVVQVIPPIQPRKLAKVPFVELADGRLQGVVSSGSDPKRVYVSSVAAGSHGFTCSTNNNRSCGGAGGSYWCNHVRALVAEAILQYGLDRVTRYLRVSVDQSVTTATDLEHVINGSYESMQAGMVFSRFLRHLSYLELPRTSEPVSELHWFPSGRGPGKAAG